MANDKTLDAAIDDRAAESDDTSGQLARQRAHERDRASLAPDGGAERRPICRAVAISDIESPADAGDSDEVTIKRRFVALRWKTAAAVIGQIKTLQLPKTGAAFLWL